MNAPSFIQVDPHLPTFGVDEPFTFHRDVTKRFRGQAGKEHPPGDDDPRFLLDPLHDGARIQVIRIPDQANLRTYQGVIRRLPGNLQADLEFVILRRPFPAHLDEARRVAELEYDMPGFYDVDTLLRYGLLGPGLDIRSKISPRSLMWVAEQVLAIRVRTVADFNAQTLAAHLWDHLG